PSADRRNSCGNKSASCAHHQAKNSRNMIRDQADLNQARTAAAFIHRTAAVQKGSPPLNLLAHRRFSEYGSIKASSPGMLDVPRQIRGKARQRRCAPGRYNANRLQISRLRSGYQIRKAAPVVRAEYEPDSDELWDRRAVPLCLPA